MSESKTELEQDEIVGLVADALEALGFPASSQDTGGGMNCVIVELPDGGQITWGTADTTWGASVTDEDGEYVSSIETDCPSDSQNIAAIVDAISALSIAAGVIVSPA